MFRICPFLRMAAICNNLAFGRVNKESDIDIFVISKSGRLFFVRTFLTGFLHLFGVRRHGNKIAGRFCLSFFIDDDFLDLSKIAIENDIYLAYWLKTMIPIADDGVSADLIDNNLWARHFFENEDDFFISNKRISKKASYLNKILEFIFGGTIGTFFENKLKTWQLKRAKRKIELMNSENEPQELPGIYEAASSDLGVVVGNHILKFHNIDHRRQWRSEWIKKYGRARVPGHSPLSIY